MSAVENLGKHQEEMMAEVQRVQDLMDKSPNGKKMMESSIAMASTEAMNNLMTLIGDTNISEEERMVLAQYMGEMLQRDPEHGMQLFSEYLTGVAADPVYEARKEYYSKVSEAASSVGGTAEYKEYIVAYKEFAADETSEAKEARDAMQEMQEKMQKWSQEG